MAVDFPNSPSVGDLFNNGERTWKWDGTAWNVYFDDPNIYGHSMNHTAAGADPLTLSQSQITGLTAALNEKVSATILNAKGDLIVATANDTAARLGVGTDGYVLTASAAATEGLVWVKATAGATGGGNDQAFYENDITITTSYTITAGKNAMTAGPVTVNTGATVTVPSGSTWTVV